MIVIDYIKYLLLGLFNLTSVSVSFEMKPKLEDVVVEVTAEASLV